uniref:Zinc finger CCCH domain-containing protein 15 n=1 Tax=Corethrella appendiculata TaxID=1370023 RepID=U5EWW1_9DIPT
MPPKKPPAAAGSKKTETKKKEKIIEDKTFGLKNKKGAKQQKFISQVEKQVKSGGQHPRDLLQQQSKKDEKEKKLKEQKEFNALFRPVITQKIEKGADPKSILCAFFKQGQCAKGDKCKFSHDLTIERKAEKRSIHVDMRDVENDGETMENWTEDKLAEVVEKKHGKDKTMPTTTIICKYFLDAVERSLYGWFWECPNGAKCIYRHCLPQGYVLKKDKKKMEKEKEEISLVDLIERERAALGEAQTRVTLETFLAWKKRKIQEKKDKELKEEEKKRNDFKSGKQIGLSGREMFSFNPDLVDDGLDDDEAAFDSYKRDDADEEDDVQYRELDFSVISIGLKESDDTGTVAEVDRWKKMKDAVSEIEERIQQDSVNNDMENNDEANDAAPINENLFLDEDLDGLDDELSDDDDDDEDDENNTEKS